MARKAPGTHSDLVRCSSCGEDYSSTYKHCPFCGDKRDSSPKSSSAKPQANNPDDDYVFEGSYVFDELDEETHQQEETVAQPRGGKRLSSANPPAGEEAQELSIWERLNLSPVRLAGFIFTFLIIIGAILIVTRIVLPMIDRGSVDVPDNNPGSTQSQPLDPDESNSPSASPSADPDADTSPDASPSPSSDPEQTDSPQPTESVPAGQTATGLTLNYEEFSISDRYPNPVRITASLTPAGTTASVAWSSSDESVATVDQNGVVTAVGKGKCTITASIPSGAKAVCLVRSSISGSSSSAPSAQPSVSPSPSPSVAPSETPSASSASLTLSREDFTLSAEYPTYTIKVTGGSGSVTWTSSNASVATVDANGKVTRVGSGRCTVTVTDANGSTAECIVRCS